MRTFTVRYRNGKISISADAQRRILMGGNISASMVRQIIEIINPELCKNFGNYKWLLQGERGNYAVIATSEHHAFVEGQGKTPAEAFWSCYQIRHIMNVE